MDNIRIADGFRGQIMHVLPGPLLKEAAKHVLVGELHPTHTGWFPAAHHHFISRPGGAQEHLLIYCTAGQGWFEMERRQQTIQPGQALLIPKGQAHSYGADGKNPWSIHWVHFAGEDAACYTSLLPHGTHVMTAAPAIRRKLRELFRECYATFSSGLTHSGIVYASQSLRHLLALLFFANPAFSPGMPTGRHRFFDNVIELMREHLDGTLTLNDLAATAGFSVARFSSLFKAQTGFSPVEYYIRLRIQAACRLFDTTDLNANEVSRHIGYTDPYYFSRIFSKIMGMPPTAYRHAKKG